MAYKGQPVPTTVHQQGFFKASDGKSVKVVADAEYKAGELALISGYLGFLTRDVKNGDEAVLTIEQAEYETDQTNEEDTMAVGTAIYWDPDAKEVTEDAEGNRKLGRVTSAKDANGVIWFILGPQV